MNKQTYKAALERAAFAVLNWDLTKPNGSEYTLRQKELGQRIADNLRGTIKNNSAPADTLISLAQDLEYITENIKRGFPLRWP